MNDQKAKSDSGKMRLSLIPREVIYGIARVREYAVTTKYKDPDNWKKVEPQRYWDATLRHIVAAWDNYKARDEESGLLHIEHACCNLAFLLEFMEKEKQNDNPD